VIYCVEDDADIREIVIYTLAHSGYEAKGFEDGKALRGALAQALPKLILLDIMLPGEDGISILKSLRADGRTKAIPVIMLTAKSAEYDKVMGLDCGADDYITKPFGMMELVARIKAVLRRSEDAEKKELLTAGDVCLDEKAHRVTAGGETVELTLKEYDLLRLLLKNRGTVFTRDRLLTEVWGYDYTGESRTVDVHVRTLRQKLNERPLIETVRGVGYRIGEDQ
jgi:two-component system alkaline phosphatase synthesis response regulator PhoP